MKFTHGDDSNFNISTIQNKSRKNIKVIFIVTCMVSIATSMTIAAKSFYVATILLAISSTGIALTTKLSLLVCESNTLFWYYLYLNVFLLWLSIFFSQRHAALSIWYCYTNNTFSSVRIQCIMIIYSIFCTDTYTYTQKYVPLAEIFASYRLIISVLI